MKKPSRKGRRFNGHLPNVKYRSVPDDSISQFSRHFVPLPAVSEDSPEQPYSYLYPQHSRKWFELRRRRLTGSTLSILTGLFEKASLKILSPGKYVRSDHERICSFVAGFRKRCAEPLPDGDPEFDRALSPELKVFMGWGTHHENSALLTFLNGVNMESDTAFSQQMKPIRVKETGLWVLPPPLDAAALGGVPFPPLAASPDGLIVSHRGWEDLEDEDADAVVKPDELEDGAWPEMPPRPEGEGEGEGEEEAEGEVPPSNIPSASSLDDDPKKEKIVALLEIKCACPFYPRRKKKKPKTTKKESKPESEGESPEVDDAEDDQRLFWGYKKRVPHDSVPFKYIPQMYSQMICTGVVRTYYVSWTLTGGTNVFLVPFDQSYSDLLLEVISKVHAAYLVAESESSVAPEEIPVDFGFGVVGEDKYRRFLQRTRELAESAKLVTHIEKCFMPPGTGKDQLFLDE